jgi:hypothetical protein
MITKNYQFPKLTEEMHNEIAEWYKTHNDGKCAKRYHGAIGGNVNFEITPTSIGDFLTVKCSCGAKLEYEEL